MSITLSDALAINDRRTTGDGYLVASARAARTGVQVYGGSEVGKPEMAVVRVYRPAEEVFSGDSLSTYANKPITLGHPPAGVSAATWKQHAVGHVDNGIVPDGQFVRVSMMIADAAAIGDLNNGTRELSAGYTCDLEWTAGTAPDGQTYDAIQRRVRINHVALVPRGRAGSDCRIGDALLQDGADIIAHLPSHMLPTLARLADAANGNEVFRAATAANMARQMADEITRTQCAGDASAQAARYVASIADRASARAAELGGNTSRPTTHDTNTKDQNMDVNDSVMRMPHDMRAQIFYSLGHLKADNRMQVEGAIQHLNGHVFRLEQSMSNPAGYFGDAGLSDAAAAIPDLIAGLKAEIGKASDRLPNLTR